MHPHQQLIENFYAAFQKRSWQEMIACYHEQVTFYDPVFENLEPAQAKAMWEMLCRNASDLSLQYDKIQADDEYGTCNWTAAYTFSQTGRPVINHIKAHFRFHEGRIIEHMDNFNLWTWSRQALGWRGWLLGWSPFVEKKIRKMARRNLQKFMAKSQNQ
jgi:uncharacterized protein